MNKVIVVLDNVRSAYNVGSIFRTADGAGVAKLLLVGYTPAPVDRFGRVQPEIKKTSLGASEMLPWEQVSDEAAPVRLAEFKAAGYSIVAIEQTDTAVPLHSFQPPEKVVYILGNEIDGVSVPLLATADQVVELPMAGSKESLNVAVTAGIMLYR